jgi:hypothetical protein
MKPLDERGERQPKTGSPSKSGLSDAVGVVPRTSPRGGSPKFATRKRCPSYIPKNKPYGLWIWHQDVCYISSVS